jgi:hypothetical protein
MHHPMVEGKKAKEGKKQERAELTLWQIHSLIHLWRQSSHDQNTSYWLYLSTLLHIGNECPTQNIGVHFQTITQCIVAFVWLVPSWKKDKNSRGCQLLIISCGNCWRSYCLDYLSVTRGSNLASSKSDFYDFLSSWLQMRGWFHGQVTTSDGSKLYFKG